MFHNSTSDNRLYECIVVVTTTIFMISCLDQDHYDCDRLSCSGDNLGLGLLPSNESQCTSTTDSQELVLNSAVHKFLLTVTVFTINQPIPIII